jgi:hypothetical protein
MIDDTLIGPDTLDDRMTGHIYLDILQNGSPEQLGNDLLATRAVVKIQHGRALSHYTRLMMEHLSDTSLIGGAVMVVGHQDQNPHQIFVQGAG